MKRADKIDTLEHFSIVSTEWSEKYERSSAFRDRLNVFLRAVGAHTGDESDILDFGCGTGVISIALARAGHNVVGLDGAQGMISAAEDAARRSEVGNVAFSVVEESHLDYPQCSFDAVVCSSVLEYLPNDLDVIQDFHRVLRPGGVLIISVPHSGSIIGKIEDLLAKLRVANRGSADADHSYSYRRYRKKQFSSSLQELGLEPVAVKYFELPRVGRLGVPLSRLSLLGVMCLVVAQKEL